MAVTHYAPNTIFLGGDRTEVNDLATADILTPGMLVMRDNTAGVIRWKKAPENVQGPCAIVTDAKMQNKGVDDTYAVGDLTEVSIGHKGSAWWMLIASGQNVEAGDLLGAAATANAGTLATGATTKLFVALENKPTVTVQTRIRVEVL